MWFPSDLIQLLDSEVSRLRAQRPGLRITRSDVVRDALYRDLPPLVLEKRDTLAMRRLAPWFPDDLIVAIDKQVTRLRKTAPEEQVITRSDVVREVLYRAYDGSTFRRRRAS